MIELKKLDGCLEENKLEWTESVPARLARFLREHKEKAYSREELNELMGKNYNCYSFGVMLGRTKKLCPFIKSKRIGLFAYYYYQE